MKLVIVGASALGRETCKYARDCGIEVRGFLDSRIHLLDGFAGYPPILGPVEAYEIKSDDVFVCALGEPEPKRKYVTMLPAAKWISVIHPTTHIGINARIGSGCIIGPHVVISNDTVIGDHVRLDVQSEIAHDCIVGDFASISPGCHIAGWCKIGDDVFAGVGATVIPHVELGKGVYLAAGAVVTKSCTTGRLMGVPARIK